MPCLTMEKTLYEIKLLKHEIQNRDIDLELCMDEEELVDFERTHSVRFPADYRTYLLEIGDGIGMGEGPCKEGILPFGRTPFGYPLGFSDIARNIRKPFPYEQEEQNETSHRDQPSLLKNKEIGGYIPLGTATRSYDHFWILVCEGECRGEVWIVTWWGSFFPCTPRMTFKDWLKDWVEEGARKSEQSLQNTKNYPLSNRTSILIEEDPPATASLFHRFNHTLRRLRSRRITFDSLESSYFDIP